MAGMRIVHHGGMCCGIKTIHGLGLFPETENTSYHHPEITGSGVNFDKFYGEEVPVYKPNHYNKADAGYRVVNSWTNIFDETAPEENGLARLKRYIDWIARKRPSHLVEVCLQMSGDCNQLEWVPLLEDLGFKEVSRFNNSNSYNDVAVFHLILEDGEVQ